MTITNQPQHGDLTKMYFALAGIELADPCALKIFKADFLCLRHSGETAELLAAILDDAAQKHPEILAQVGHHTQEGFAQSGIENLVDAAERARLWLTITTTLILDPKAQILARGGLEPVVNSMRKYVPLLGKLADEIRITMETVLPGLLPAITGGIYGPAMEEEGNVPKAPYHVILAEAQTAARPIWTPALPAEKGASHE